MGIGNLSDTAGKGLDQTRLERIGRWLDSQVSSNRVAGASVLIGKGGEPAYFHASGIAGADVAAGDGASPTAQTRAFDRDTIVRLYSMTKPVTTVAALTLFEQGKFQLDDPIAWYLPAFADVRVWTGTGELQTPDEQRHHTTRLESPITVRQLMNHTAGFTYGFMNATPVDRLYRDEGLVFPGSSEKLEALVDRLAQAPLLCQPGTQWNYSVATDVLGRLVEIWSGQSLGDYFKTYIFTPLAMQCTGFHVQQEEATRFADLYTPAAGGDLGNVGGSASVDKSAAPAAQQPVLDPPVAVDVLAGTSFLEEPALYSGGGGLVGSIDDYARFCQCLLNGGELDGVRLLGRKTVEFMRQNHLPDNRDMAAMGQAVWSETSYQGIGFGLGFAVVLDPVKSGMITSRGEYHWGGAASTVFWIDPVEDLYVILLTQLYPSSSYPLRKELRTAVYQAIT
ncbi:MAG: serine hydrolase domain-containing protein [Granulosicoccus sp.]